LTISLFKVDNKTVMARLRKRGEQIRNYILENTKDNPSKIAVIAAEKFGVSRQAISKHIKKLVDQGALAVSGNTRQRRYSLLAVSEQNYSFPLDYEDLEEDTVWRSNVEPWLGELPDNIIDIWQYGITEMINNVIDHSSGTQLEIQLTKTAQDTKVMLYDNGEGIFRKIQRELGLEDERHAVLELSKGKLTTDPANHTGAGIFFTSRAFDNFAILSGGVYFSHKYEDIDDWILERDRPQSGTYVFMEISNNTARTIKSVFDQFTTEDSYGFNKTVVPVALAKYGNENLVSRSQAKRLLARFDRFKVVLLDFKNVKSIGQAFADEIFRVFQNRNLDIELVPVNTTSAVDQMISRAMESKI